MKIVWENAGLVTEENKPKGCNLMLVISKDGDISANYISEDVQASFINGFLAYALIPIKDIELRDEILMDQSGLNDIIASIDIKNMIVEDFAKIMKRAFRLGLVTK